MESIDNIIKYLNTIYINGNKYIEHYTTVFHESERLNIFEVFISFIVEGLIRLTIKIILNTTLLVSYLILRSISLSIIILILVFSIVFYFLVAFFGFMFTFIKYLYDNITRRINNINIIPTRRTPIVTNIIPSHHIDIEIVQKPKYIYKVTSINNINYNESIEINYGDCSICCEDFEDISEIKTLICKHIFHKKCVDDWLVISNTCPLCRTKQCNL